jgi:hypothetical protein
MTVVRFGRAELDSVCHDLGITRIKNIGDIVYSFRYRSPIPEQIQKEAPQGYCWIILGAGVAQYEFRLAKVANISVGLGRQQIKIPDSTPEILKMYAPGVDEQALLTKVRYNRLVDIFTGLTTYSVQNHYRTTVDNIGQIEVDEIYVGINKHGSHFVMPCQAKSPSDCFGVAQVYQDMKLCAARFPGAICRPLAIQFTGEDSLAILELMVEEHAEAFELVVVEEKHYKLVPRSDISDIDLKTYQHQIT